MVSSTSSRLHSRSAKHDASHNSSDVAVEDRRQPAAKQESWLQKTHLGKAKLGLTSSSAKLGLTSSSSNGNNNTDVKFASVKLRSVSASNSVSSNGSGSSSIGHKSFGFSAGSRGGGVTASAKKQTLSWMEALKKKQKNLRLTQMADVDDQDDGVDGGPPTLQEKGNRHADAHAGGRSVAVGSSGNGSDSGNDDDGGGSGSGDNNKGVAGGIVLRRAGGRSVAVDSSGNGNATGNNDDGGGSGRGDNNNGVAGGMVLRRFLPSPRKKPRITPPSTPEEQVAPWSRVQLKTTPKKRGSMHPTLMSTTVAATSSHPSSSTLAMNDALPTIQTNASWGSSASSLTYSPTHSVHTMSKHSKEVAASLFLPPLCCLGDIIDLDALPQKVFPLDEGPAAVFPLERSSSSTKQVQEETTGEVPERVVIVGKTAIVTASLATASSDRGKASITWWCRRTEIRALTLNVEATGANLSHVHGRTPLLFESADVCLEFAQVFYRGPSRTVKSAEEDVRKRTSSTSAPLEIDTRIYSLGAASLKSSEKSPENGTRSDPQPTKSNLTEDEESLLDRYRQFSHSDRTKLRLTCLSPRGDMQEVEVSLSPPSMASNNPLLRGIVGRAQRSAVAAPEAVSDAKSNDALSEDEEKLASKYRKMLKMGIPPDAVRLKMTSDEIPLKIVSAILGGGDEKNEQAKGVSLDGNKLSDKDEAIANKFRKMMKMRIPPDAVRHKMTMEGLDAKIINAVFDDASPKKDELSSEEEVIASKYRKMLKMGIPLSGVEFKMKQEGIDLKIISALVKQKPPSSDDAENAKKHELSSEEEVIASKYRKMLKMGVPLSGVEFKMKQEGIDLKIISALVKQKPPSSDDAENDKKPPGSKKSSTKSAAAPLLLKEEEAIASKYRKMLKVCIPKVAVRQKMNQEGVSIKIMEAVLGKETNDTTIESTSNTANTRAPPRGGAKNTANNRKTIAFHWTTSNLAPELLEQSIFGKGELKKRKIASINPEEADIKKLEEIFQKRNNAKMKGGAAGGKGGDEVGSDMAKLLDFTRANNIAISLKAFNDFTFRSFAETINDLDPDCKIVGERVQFVSKLLPTPKEIQAIKKYKGEDEQLIPAELFFRQLAPMKRIEDKVQVMRTMSTLEEHVEEARVGFKTLQEVCSQVMNSERLIQVLEMVLNIGNLMNAGSVNGGVEAFKFESLPRLSQTKSADGKTTVLDYIVETFIEKGERKALLLLGEFPDIQESSRLSIGDLMGDMNTLRNDFKLCKKELESMKRDQSSKRVTRSMSKKIKDENNGEGNDPKNALFAAIKARGDSKEKSDSPKPAESSDPMQALFGAIKNRKKGPSTSNNGDSPPPSDVKYSPGVHRLEKFLIHSKTILSFAGQDQDAAIRACKGLAVYCGEEGGERSAVPLLQVLSGFALSLENGVKKYDQRVAAEMKKAAKKKKETEKKKKEIEKEEGKENSNRGGVGRNLAVAPTPPSSLRLLRASSMQPHFGVTARVKKVTPKKQGNGDCDVSLGCGSTNQKETDDPKQALLASIKNGRDSSRLPSKSRPPPGGIPVRLPHVNNTAGQDESRIMMVNRMLSEAPASVKQDFLKGVTHRKTDDPLLRKIYEKEEDKGERKGDDYSNNTIGKNWKSVDRSTDLFAAIRNKKTPT